MAAAKTSKVKRKKRTLEDDMRELAEDLADLNHAVLTAIRKRATTPEQLLEQAQKDVADAFAKMGDETSRILFSVGGGDVPVQLATTFVEMRSRLKFAESDVMRKIVAKVNEYAGQSVSMYALQKDIAGELIADGVTSVRYSNGVRMPLSAYTMMAARAARAETDAANAISQAQKLGSDYVYMPPTSNGCRVCIERSGRVYCISGKDNAYPPLFGENGLYTSPSGYLTIHPNCRCPLIPYFPEQHDTAERAKMKAASNRKRWVPEDSPVLKEYQREQDYNRLVIEEQRAYEKDRAKMGADFPYKNIGSYRRARRAYAIDNGTTRGFLQTTE